jgi:hypothetical protein
VLAIESILIFTHQHSHARSQACLVATVANCCEGLSTITGSALNAPIQTPFHQSAAGTPEPRHTGCPASPGASRSRCPIARCWSGAIVRVDRSTTCQISCWSERSLLNGSSRLAPFPSPIDPPVSPAGLGTDPSHHRQPESLPEQCLRPGFIHLRHQWLGDPESLYQVCAQVAPIRDFRSLVPTSHFYQWGGLLDLGDVALAFYASSNVSFTIDDAPAVHLVACFGGYRRVIPPSGEVHTTPGDVALLPMSSARPGAATTPRSSPSSPSRSAALPPPSRESRPA